MKIAAASEKKYLEWFSYVLAVLALFIILKEGLLLALFSGLLVYSLVRILIPSIQMYFKNANARVLAVGFLSCLIVTVLGLGIWGTVHFLRSDAGNLHSLLQKLAEMIEGSRQQLPLWLSENLPQDVVALKEILINGLRQHAGEAKAIGQEAGHIVVHGLLGMIIASMIALNDVNTRDRVGPLALALQARVALLAEMFHRVVFAQVKISLINTVFTGLYLALILPLFGIDLPLVKSMIAITFIAGLIPVIGNIVSNTVIVIVSLSYSMHIAVISLAYMVIIHKLEYFLNARIIGAQVQATSWELLLAILLMETMFGLPGLVAAPVFYAYVKKECVNLGWI
jgi:predicted PurR-regulated permease PerM